MFDEDGRRISEAQAIAVVLARGGLLVTRAPVESLDLAAWRRTLRRLARDRGRRLSIRSADQHTGRSFFILDPDYQPTAAQLRAAIVALPRTDGITARHPSAQ